ncbi:MAG: hypothetical protein A3E79_10290 [Burkholderiales bacterium RIFCSPHIGHO2_12_FULL_61_11]|nr:MAG: hypothetical protein A3E79_10290 [Burkholderiales bacterium RIFCSPHIGHO2_12_FULL_61_11]
MRPAEKRVRFQVRNRRKHSQLRTTIGADNAGQCGCVWPVPCRELIEFPFVDGHLFVLAFLLMAGLAPYGSAPYTESQMGCPERHPASARASYQYAEMRMKHREQR